MCEVSGKPGRCPLNLIYLLARFGTNRLRTAVNAIQSGSSFNVAGPCYPEMEHDSRHLGRRIKEYWLVSQACDDPLIGYKEAASIIESSTVRTPNHWDFRGTRHYPLAMFGKALIFTALAGLVNAQFETLSRTLAPGVTITGATVAQEPTTLTVGGLTINQTSTLSNIVIVEDGTTLSNQYATLTPQTLNGTTRTIPSTTLTDATVTVPPLVAPYFVATNSLGSIIATVTSNASGYFFANASGIFPPPANYTSALTNLTFPAANLTFPTSVASGVSSYIASYLSHESSSLSAAAASVVSVQSAAEASAASYVSGQAATVSAVAASVAAVQSSLLASYSAAVASITEGYPVASSNGAATEGTGTASVVARKFRRDGCGGIY
ncbi:hypothetical protein G7K_2915-t1 [Saitoella complicata NRRL Y-17804]|uniref:Uncharacterized protein n=2 Tax=Saitoella complicata (strain BCRC 22490 / CBS 7301 / JCM 7358 / NBRC 10748 / NRRL Y-17804) TaxID=698492 RepID=A0A0E9NH60_SAICN|nr:hypothetical protein G7K_2915-t1 [Saitoella complicata NRRL Y-17804]